MCTFIEAHDDNTFGIRWCDGCEQPSRGFALVDSASGCVAWHIDGEHGVCKSIDAAMLEMERVAFDCASSSRASNRFVVAA